VSDGVSTIRKVAAIWRALDEEERSFLNGLIDQSGFGVLEHLTGQGPVEQVVRLVRRVKANEAKRAGTPTAA
jgi:hypothetical protein